MAELGLEVRTGTGILRWRGNRADEVTLGWRGSYAPGDQIVLSCAAPPQMLAMCLDRGLSESVVLLTDRTFTFMIPFGDERKAYGPRAFAGERHWGYVRVLDERERESWRNLAENSHDLSLPSGSAPVLYPHAVTNVRCDNPQFLARNAIDGVFETGRHGSWPHESWGINDQRDAWLKIEFGRSVIADELRLYLRTDFPHDTWWRSALLTLSDGQQVTLRLAATGLRQTFPLGGARIAWLALSQLEKAEEHGFPGLSQIMVMGRETDPGSWSVRDPRRVEDDQADTGDTERSDAK
ncbi:hypothetical protein Corgl_1674 [Coriobacterium glomerans PW2]|uniref:Carbohydrate-binding protein n=2 Tax=Coriobacterium TaxID=33870 RepID=F2NB21_CORGP|nr:hypothetical protein Corgl_1674 [Coriobacterium glomerans PW2]